MNYSFKADAEQFTFLAESAMSIPEETIDKLSFEDTRLCFEVLHCAAHSIEVNSSESGVVRAEFSEKADEFLTRLTDFPLPDEITAELSGKNVFIPSIQGFRTWKNVEILKDKCLAGFYLSKQTGGRCVFHFGKQNDEYPYLEYVPGLEMPLVDTDNFAAVFERFLEKNLFDMDIVFFNGIYLETEKYVEFIKKHNKKSITITAFDMNSVWFNEIAADSDWFYYLKYIDVLTTSGRETAKLMNKSLQIKKPVFWIPNGYYGEYKDDEFIEKENIILTVGRIGTEQKNNERLLSEFALIADKLPDWKLRLVGGVSDEFLPFIDEFFKTFPQLKERITFTGAISDKTALDNEYKRAKIFILTSRLEGGNPNVFAESLSHNCFMIMSSDIDSAKEMTDTGNIGIIYDSQTADTAAEAMINAAEKMSSEKFYSAHKSRCRVYLNRYFGYDRVTKRYMWLTALRK